MALRERLAKGLWFDVPVDQSLQWADKILVLLRNETAETIGKELGLVAIRCPNCTGNGHGETKAVCQTCEGRKAAIVRKW